MIPASYAHLPTLEARAVKVEAALAACADPYSVSETWTACKPLLDDLAEQHRDPACPNGLACWAITKRLNAAYLQAWGRCE